MVVRDRFHCVCWRYWCICDNKTFEFEFAIWIWIKIWLDYRNVRTMNSTSPALYHEYTATGDEYVLFVRYIEGILPKGRPFWQDNIDIENFWAADIVYVLCGVISVRVWCYRRICGLIKICTIRFVIKPSTAMSDSGRRTWNTLEYIWPHSLSLVRSHQRLQ